MSAAKHADLYRFFKQLLPEEELLYHSPLPPHRPYDPSTTRFVAQRLILSLTPTQGVYNALNRPGRSCLFLHRPFRLDRRRVPHGTLVLQSHVRFDEILTTGWNEAFADEHLISRDGRICIKGYKNKPERRIGLVGQLTSGMDASIYARMLSHAFNGHEALSIPQAEDSLQPQIHALATLNAFTPEVIERVAAAITQLDAKADNTICLTGAVRDPGMEEARKLGMSVIAVGHQRCEYWGIRYLERIARQRFPDLEILIIDEPEEMPERTSPQQMTTKKGGRDAGQTDTDKSHISSNPKEVHNRMA